MLRDLIVQEGLAPAATFKANEAMKTGFAVVKNYADGTADLPEAETASELFFVQKARVPFGANAAKTDFSDYDSAFNDVAEGELVSLVKYPDDSVFATDAFDTTTLIAGNIGKVVSAGTDGKLALATASTVNSKYEFLGLITDNGHTLAKIHVLENAKANS